MLFNVLDKVQPIIDNYCIYVTTIKESTNTSKIYKSEITEPVFLFLIELDKISSIDQAFIKFRSEEVLDWDNLIEFSNSFKVKRKLTKKIICLPDTLIIVLKRYKYKGVISIKITKAIDFSEILTIPAENINLNFRLSSGIVH